jgi:hypothetical protein
LLGQSRLHHRTVEDLQHVRHAAHSVRNHVLNRRPAGEWCALDLPVQPSLILAGCGQGGIDLRQIGRDPQLARGEAEAGTLADRVIALAENIVSVLG